MQRAGAAEGHEREMTRIMPALDGDHTDGANHVVVDNCQYTARRSFERKVERKCYAILNDAPRCIGIEAHSAAEEFCRQVAKHDMSVCYGRLASAMSISGGAGSRACTARADRQRPVRNSRYRAATSSNGHHVDHR